MICSVCGEEEAEYNFFANALICVKCLRDIKADNLKRELEGEEDDC